MNYKEELKLLKKNEEYVYCIHYACEFLNDENANISPRITCIVIVSFKDKKSNEFSIGTTAEKLDISKDDINTNLDLLEKEMLKEYFNFLDLNKNSFWLHWNMNTKNYGFEAIEHRYEVLTKEKAPIQIENHNKKSLSFIIINKYGKEYVNEPYMYNLMKITSRHRDILNGKDEVLEFHTQNYNKLYKSTLAKAWWIKNIYYELQANKLKLNIGIGNKIGILLENPYIKLALAIVAIAGLVLAFKS